MFKDRLKQLRKKSGLTQKQLAAQISMSERGIQNYEMGIREPQSTVLISLADYFGCSVDYLLGRTDNPEINK